MKIILFTETFQRIDQFIAAYNKKETRKDFQIRTQHRKTIYEMVLSYNAQLIKAATFQQSTTGVYLKEFRPLRANNKQLATSTGCNSRTIQNHIQRLKFAGIILDKKNHGTFCDYDLTFNLELLICNANPFFSDNCKTIPLTEHINYKNINNKDKVISNSCEGLNEQLTRACTQLTLQKVFNSSQQQELKIEFATASESPMAFDGKAGKVNNQTSFNSEQQNNHNFSKEYKGKNGKFISGGLPDSIVNNYVERLWLFIMNVLYNEMTLTTNQEAIGKKYLFLFFMGAKSEKTLKTLYSIGHSRIMKTVKYLERNKKSAWIPSIHFNPENRNGFAGTKSWYEEDQIKHQIFSDIGSKEIYIKKIINEFARNLQQKEMVSKKGVRKVDDTTMFLNCLHRIERGKHPELAETFLNSVIQNGLLHNYSSIIGKN